MWTSRGDIDREELEAKIRALDIPEVNEALDRAAILKADNLPNTLSETLYETIVRTPAVRRFSFAIPDDAALAALVRYSPILEIGAGTGYWAALAAAAGADVRAYDISPPVKGARVGNLYHGKRGTHFDVKRGGAPVAARYPDRTLFLCWPPYKTPMASNCLQHYAGRRVIYIGEDCTADDHFRETLSRDWNLVDEVYIPQWYGIHDRMEIYER